MAVRGGSNDATLPSVASETIGADQGQIVRLDAGTGTTRVPVAPLTDAQLRAGAVPVSAAAWPLPAGAATEAKLEAIRLLLTSGPSEYPEDSAHVSGDPGSFMLAVRNSALAALTSADGDYSGIAVDAQGRIILPALALDAATLAALETISVANFPATQPISAASLPLPAGAATQTTLASVLTALGSPAQAGGNVPITRSSNSADTTIASGASLSGSLALSAHAIIGLIIAGTWTAAAMTFQASHDNTTFVNLYDDAGNEVQITSANMGSGTRGIANAGVLEKLAPFQYVKFRSGTSATPVNQAQAVTIRVQRKG